MRICIADGFPNLNIGRLIRFDGQSYGASKGLRRRQIHLFLPAVSFDRHDAVSETERRSPIMMDHGGLEEVELKILQASIGDISESDVMLAEASSAVIIGFSVGVDKSALVRAEQSGVEIRHYDIIYKMIEDIEDALKGMLEPIYKDVVVGHATVLQLFKLRKGVIAGCMVNDGYVKRGALARVLRGGEEIASGSRVETLRRFTEDVAEVRTGYECGINVGAADSLLKEGDVIEFSEKQRVR